MNYKLPKFHPLNRLHPQISEKETIKYIWENTYQEHNIALDDFYEQLKRKKQKDEFEFTIILSSLEIYVKNKKEFFNQKTP